MQRFMLGFLLLATLFLSGFDFSKHSIPTSEIRSGGPPKDGIPAILNPKFVQAKAAGFLKKNDRVLGLVLKGAAKAYPIKILNWHEIVNDTLGGQAVFVSYCPLCGTGMAFDAHVNGKKHSFGVSGLLYKSDVLMYDHQTESLWSQIKQEAVAGPLTGARLKLLPLRHTTWEAWRKAHPESLVLSRETGYRRDYDRDPYASYEKTDRLMFPVGAIDPRYPPKSWVLGLERSGVTRAYPFSELEKQAPKFKDKIASEEIWILYDPGSRSVRVENQGGEILPIVTAYWFAWSAFHPETEVYVSPQAQEDRRKSQ